MISGINRGGNLGENIFYSGTVGAAMEAAINRVPALAISVAYRGGKESDFEPAAQFARPLAQFAAGGRAARWRAAECQCAAAVERRRCVSRGSQRR